MIAYITGRALFGNDVTPLNRETVTASEVASITFSGVDGYQIYLLDFYWLNSRITSESLTFTINALTTPSGSVMARSQVNASLGTREDRQDPDFTISDLISVAAGTFSKGVLYFSGHVTDVGARYAYGQGYNNDAAITLGDRQRTFIRQGIWNDNTTEITSLTIQTATGRSAIGVGSIMTQLGF